MKTEPIRVAIIGAGAAGLAAGVRLKRRGARVSVFESAARAGGVIATREQNGFLHESGPNSLVDGSRALYELLEELSLDGQMLFASDSAKKRFIVRNNALVPIPMSPLSFLSTGLFSASGKTRIFSEPFVPRYSGSGDESVTDFFARRLGREVLDYAVEPFVAGIYAGDPDRLSVRHAFPRVHMLERRHGSLIRGGIAALKSRKAATGRRPTRKLFSFPKGMGTLTDAMAVRLGRELHLSTKARAIARIGRFWRVVAEGDDSEAAGDFSAVLLTLPTHRLCDLSFDAQIEKELDPIRSARYSPVAVCALGFSRSEVGHPLDGFGMLVPRAEKRRILGALFSSSLFPRRAPEGMVLVTVFVGGERNPKLPEENDDHLIDAAMSDLRPLLAIRGPIRFRSIERRLSAIPQYEIGYGKTLDAISQVEAEHPGLYFAGSYRGGISVPDTIESAMRTADRIAENLK